MDPEETLAMVLLASAPKSLGTRRQLLAGAAGTLASIAATQPAFAKKGEFGNLGVFVQGGSDLSSPYLPNGQKVGVGSTYGLASDGVALAKDWRGDSDIQKQDLQKAYDIVCAQIDNAEKAVWWLAMDNIRGNDVYQMRKEMLQLAGTAPNKRAAKNAARDCMAKLDEFDLALRAKDIAAARTELAAFKASFATFQSLV
jgi:hypothetical protein